MTIINADFFQWAKDNVQLIDQDGNIILLDGPWLRTMPYSNKVGTQNQIDADTHQLILDIGDFARSLEHAFVICCHSVIPEVVQAWGFMNTFMFPLSLNMSKADGPDTNGFWFNYNQNDGTLIRD